MSSEGWGLHNGQGYFSGGLLFYDCVVKDITERKMEEEQIHNLAFHDTLTQLPNRSLLNDRLEQAMAISTRSGIYGALMFLDIDNFKPLNDTYGHDVGDLLLVEVACRTSRCVREVDTVARFGVVLFINRKAQAKDIIKWADMAMYQTKEAGRNQVRFHDVSIVS